MGIVALNFLSCVCVCVCGCVCVCVCASGDVSVCVCDGDSRERHCFSLRGKKIKWKKLATDYLGNLNTKFKGQLTVSKLHGTPSSGDTKFIIALPLKSFKARPKYWVVQKVHLGFSISCYRHSNEHFGQHNISIQLTCSQFHPAVLTGGILFPAKPVHLSFYACV